MEFEFCSAQDCISWKKSTVVLEQYSISRDSPDMPYIVIFIIIVT